MVAGGGEVNGSTFFGHTRYSNISSSGYGSQFEIAGFHVFQFTSQNIAERLLITKQ